MFIINKKKINICILSELVRCYCDLISDQLVEVIYTDRSNNSKVLIHYTKDRYNYQSLFCGLYGDH